MSELLIPIAERSRKYGYMYWPADLDHQMSKLLKDINSVNLVFESVRKGKKLVDWKYRRISIGYKWTRRIPEKAENFVLTLTGKNTLDVVCR